MRPRDDAFLVISAHGFGSVGKRLNARIRWGSAEACWEYSGHTVNGYGRLCIGGVRILAHRVAWIVANRADPGGLLVCHRCDNRLCCNPRHLFLGTALDNVRDMDAKGRGVREGRKVGVKLTADDAEAIRKSHLTPRELAEAYGLNEQYVRNIITGARWNPDAAAARRAAYSELKASRFHSERVTR